MSKREREPETGESASRKAQKKNDEDEVRHIQIVLVSSKLKKGCDVLSLGEFQEKDIAIEACGRMGSSYFAYGNLVWRRSRRQDVQGRSAEIRHLMGIVDRFGKHCGYGEKHADLFTFPDPFGGNKEEDEESSEEDESECEKDGNERMPIIMYRIKKHVQELKETKEECWIEGRDVVYLTTTANK